MHTSSCQRKKSHNSLLKTPTLWFFFHPSGSLSEIQVILNFLNKIPCNISQFSNVFFQWCHFWIKSFHHMYILFKKYIYIDLTMTCDHDWCCLIWTPRVKNHFFFLNFKLANVCICYLFKTHRSSSFPSEKCVCFRFKMRKTQRFTPEMTTRLLNPEYLVTLNRQNPFTFLWMCRF